MDVGHPHIPLIYSSQDLRMESAPICKRARHTDEMVTFSSPPSSSSSVVIVGGGLGGLACALALQLAGFRDVKVYERDGAFADRMQGYGLTLTNNPKGPLARLGLLTECIERDCASECHWIFGPQGEIRGYYGRGFSSSSSNVNESTGEGGTCEEEEGGGKASMGRGNLRVPRQDLRRMLLARLAPNTVQWGYRLLGYSEDCEGLTASFISTSHATATALVDANVRCSVLVGADGINSIVRQLRDAEEFEPIQSTIINSSINSVTPPSNTTSTTAAATVTSTSSNNDMCRQEKEKDASSLHIFSSSISSNSVSIADAKNMGSNLGLLSPTPLCYLGVAVIIGLSSCVHPLVHRQGFYILDGTHRLFTMPYREANEEASTSALHMWQLSFSGLELHTALQLRSMSAADLLAEAARRTANWMVPVGDLLACTSQELVWGTPLYDRNPMLQHGTKDTTQIQGFKSRPAYGRAAAGGKAALGSRVVLLGDAAHPMSMFKGQGCNQAMEDGPLLVSWLQGGNQQKQRQKQKQKQKLKPGSAPTTATASTPTAVTEEEGMPIADLALKRLSRETLLRRLRCYEREMVARSSVKQAASREAAKMLHSAIVSSESEEAATLFGFEGIADQYKQKTLSSISNGSSSSSSSHADVSGVTALGALHAAFKEGHVTAACGVNLEDRVGECIARINGVKKLDTCAHVQTEADEAAAAEGK